MLHIFFDQQESKFKDAIKYVWDFCKEKGTWEYPNRSWTFTFLWHNDKLNEGSRNYHEVQVVEKNDKDEDDIEIKYTSIIVCLLSWWNKSLMQF